MSEEDSDWWSACEEFGCVYVIVDSKGDEETHRCTDCGNEYTD